MSVRILIGDCRERLKELPDNSVDSCGCDPPYHLTSIVKRFGARNAAPAKIGKTGAYERASRGFMGQTWDGGDVAFDPATWAEVLRVLKPGGHLVAFSGTRTYHRMACAIEDAGFEIRDQLAWCYGSGFPKSHDVSKGIDLAAGHKRASSYIPNGKNTIFNDGKGGGRGGAPSEPPVTPEAEQWQGWGTALKPAWEPICLARKPLIGTVVANVLEHGTGAINIDACRIEAQNRPHRISNKETANGRGAIHGGGIPNGSKADGETDLGRWPANLVHDGSEEVLAGFPLEAGSTGGTNKVAGCGFFMGGDSRLAARFFYCAKADSVERHEGCTDLDKGNNHPTVKPVDLMRWLVRLITPKGGTVLDPFMGSGSTMIAADAEQFNGIGIELSPEYAAIAERRIRAAAGMFAEVLAA